jgi:hypothetical protein
MFELIDELNNPQSPLYKVVQGHLDLKKAELEVKKAEVELKKIEVECQILSAGSLGNDRNKLLKRLESVNTKE